MTVAPPTLPLTPPPPAPPAWLWSCHICHATYPLGATRRCLVDGHRFCAGTLTHNRRTGKLRRSTPCGSVFDYVGWRAYGEWRRHELAARRRAAAAVPPDSPVDPTHTGPSGGALPRPLNLRRSSALQPGRRAPSPETEAAAAPAATGLKGGTPAPSPLAPPRPHHCARDCDFPSECRWRPHMAGTPGSAVSTASSTSAPATPPPPFAPLPPSPTSPTDPSSPLAAAMLHDGFPEAGEEDEVVVDVTVADARVEKVEDGDEEIRDVCEAVERKGDDREAPVSRELEGEGKEGEIGLAISTEGDVDMEDDEGMKGETVNESTTASEQGIGYNRLWDWSIGGLSSLGGIGSGRAGEMDGGVR